MAERLYLAANFIRWLLTKQKFLHRLIADHHSQKNMVKAMTGRVVCVKGSERNCHRLKAVLSAAQMKCIREPVR